MGIRIETVSGSAGSSRSREAILASPFTIRKVQFHNRFVALPVGFSHSIDSAATPTERMIARYRRRAQGGAALVTIEATFVAFPPYQPSKWGLPGFYSDSQVPQYTNLTDAIRAAGSKSSLQIFGKWHADFPYEMADLTAAQIESMIDSSPALQAAKMEQLQSLVSAYPTDKLSE